MEPVIESLRPGDEAARFELARLAFGRQDRYDPARPAPTLDEQVAAYSGHRLVGAVTLHPGAQFWGGRAVSMGGIASVCVAPDLRGRDLARRMMREALRRMHARGDALSALYPTTATLYRGLGYEVAGWWTLTEIPVADLRGAVAADLVVEPGTLDDVDAAYRLVAPQHPGWLDRTERQRAVVHYDIDTAKEPKAIFRARRDGELVGAVAYRETSSGGRLFDIAAGQLLAADEHVLAALLRLLGANGTMARAVRTYLPDRLLAHAVPHAQHLVRAYQFPFMVRIVDVASAVAQRGFAPGVDAEVHLDLHGDAELAHNNGRFVLRVREGRGTLEPGGRGTVSLDVRRFAAVFCGAAYADPALSLACSGPPASLVDFF